MEKRLFVGNLPFDLSEDELHELFSTHWQVASTRLIMDFNTGQSRRFGFVEMRTEEDAKDAIEKMNKAKVREQEIVVNEARPRPPKTGGPQGGGSRGGNRSGGFGGGYSGGFDRGNRY